MDTTPEHLVREHGPRLRALAARLVGEGDADDVVQQAWVAAWKAKPDRPGNWLNRVVRRIAGHVRRDAAAVRERERRAAQPAAWQDATAPLERREALEALAAGLAALPNDWAEVVLLRHADGLPPREIAKRLGIPVNTVRSRARRGLARLREVLERRGADWRPALAGISASGSGSKTTAAASIGVVLMSTKTLAAAALAGAVLLMVALPRIGLEPLSREGDPPASSRPEPGRDLEPTELSEVAHLGDARREVSDSNEDSIEAARTQDPAESEPIPKWRLAGIVLGSDEEALPGAQVVFSYSPDHAAVSDENGRWQFPLEGPQNIPRRLSVALPGYVQWQKDLNGLPESFQNGTYWVEVRLKLGSILELRVLDDQGTPLEGAFARLRPTERGSWGTIVSTTSELKSSAQAWQLRGAGNSYGVTGADGTQALRGVAPGSVRLYVSHEGFIPWTDVVQVPNPDSPPVEVVVRLDRGNVVRGLVVDPAGEPVEGASVWINSRTDCSAVTDARGRFSVQGRPRDTRNASFLVLADGWAPAWFWNVEALDREVVLPVGLGGSIQLRLLDGVTKEGITAQVSAQYLFEDDYVGQGLLQRGPGPFVQDVERGELSLGLVPSYALALSIEVEGYEPCRWEPPTPLGMGLVEGTATLVPEEELEIRIVDGITGKPVAGATVQVTLTIVDEYGNRGSTLMTLDWGSERSPGTFVLPSGRLRARGSVGDVMPEQAWVHVMRQGYRRSERLTYIVDGAPPPPVLTVQLEPE